MRSAYAQPRNYGSEEAAKSQQLLQGVKVQLQTASCQGPTTDDLGTVNELWRVVDLEQVKAKLNACKDRMDNMDAG